MKIGDKVAVIDQEFTGVIKSVNKDQISVETEEGFIMTFFVKELVKLEITNNLYDSIGNFSLNKIKQEKEASSIKKTTLVKRVKGEIPPQEVDLHLEKLVKNAQRISPSDALELQLSQAQFHIENAIKKRAPKLVLIHGVGEGILKYELERLIRRYSGISTKEGSYQKYGLGAMELQFRY